MKGGPRLGDKDSQRFAFGENWAKFLNCIDDQRIAMADSSLRTMLEVENLEGKTFLDIGSGSGLFSLAARRLGATVRSFDYDPQSVSCTAELKRRFFPGDPCWVVERGSILDRAYLQSLGLWDVVYSWGVLHHTGAMWQAFENVASLAADNGKLLIAIYNDQGGKSRRWKRIKRVYNRLPAGLRLPFALLVIMPRELYFLLVRTAQGKPFLYVSERVHYSRTSLRGMSWWHDLIDWVGGYPFEVARPEEVFRFFRDRGFALRQMTTQGGGSGCNEFLFQKGMNVLQVG